MSQLCAANLCVFARFARRERARRASSLEEAERHLRDEVAQIRFAVTTLRTTGRRAARRSRWQYVDARRVCLREGMRVVCGVVADREERLRSPVRRYELAEPRRLPSDVALPEVVLECAILLPAR